MSDSGSFSHSSSRTTSRRRSRAWAGGSSRPRPSRSRASTSRSPSSERRPRERARDHPLRPARVRGRDTSVRARAGALPRDALRRNARSPRTRAARRPGSQPACRTGWSDSACIEREARPWLPHVTVVRFRERPRLDPPLPSLGRFAPSGAAAFLSRLHPTGARYEALESYPFERDRRRFEAVSKSAVSDSLGRMTA